LGPEYLRFLELAIPSAPTVIKRSNRRSSIWGVANSD
jgi:hypothetical protein